MDINLRITDNDDVNKTLGILEIGILTALESKIISIDEAEELLFNRYNSRVLQESGVNQTIVEVIELGCELEDVKDLIPYKLENEIAELKQKVMDMLITLKKTGNFSGNLVNIIK